tara:strand:- start:80 stop:2788 length:2709 start_codon:yes stop_codon:yes gene_type:complete
VAKKGTKIGEYTRPRLHAATDQHIKRGVNIDTSATDPNGNPALEVILKADDDGTSTGILVDVDKVGDSTSTTLYGINIDTSNIVQSGGFNAVYGLRSKGTAKQTADSGVAIAYGGFFEAEGDTNGVSVIAAVYAEADGGDTNYAIYANKGTSHFNVSKDANTDFQVSGDTETHLLFVDAGNERVSIGDSTDAPAATLEVTNNASAGAYNVPLLQLNNNDVDQIALDINAANTTANVIDITADAVTTGKVINITADALTAGSGSMLNLVSNSSSDSQRSLAKIVQDHTTPARTTLLHIVNDTQNSTTLSPGTDFTSSYASSVIIEHTGEPTHTALEFRNSYAADDSVYQVVLFNRTHAAVADNIGLGEIQFGAKNSANEGLVYAQISSQASDITNGDEGGKIAFEVSADGTGGTAALKNLLSIGGEDVAGGIPCAVTINEAGIDCDFRVEGDTETHLLYVDAGNERVSIGDSVDAPAATLEITNNASAGSFDVPLLQLNSNDIDQIALDINAANTTANVIDITADAVTTGKVISVSADALTAGSGSMLSLVSDSSSDQERSLVKIHNDNTSANRTNCLHILSDAVMTTLETGMKQAPVIIETTAADTTLLELRGSGTHGGRPPTLTFNRSDTGSDADGMLIGAIDFYATDSANNATEYASITIEADDFTDGSGESAQMDFDLLINGTTTSLLKMGSDRPFITFNESGIDCDFRVESNDNSNMFVIDGGESKVSVAGFARGHAEGFAVFNDYQSTAFESNLTIDGNFGSAEVLIYSPGAGDTPTTGQICFLHTDGTWDAADASAVATGASQLLGVFPTGVGDTQSRGLVTRGFIRIPSTEILNTPGSGAVDGLPLYISTTAGHFDFTAPSASGEFVRIVGYAIDDDSSDVLVYFDPDKTFVEIA